MSKIGDLINQLCPDGVEYKRLGDVAEIGTGSSNTQDQIPDGTYPFYVRSPEIKRSDKFEFNETAIVTAGDGDVGKVFHFVKGKYALHQRAYRVKVLRSSLDTKFLFYYMKTNFRPYIERKACSATVKSLRKPMFQDFQIPVPPLPVQQEIVDILDKFTALQTALQTELDLRKQQYEYYRNQLLSFDYLKSLPGGASVLTLGDIGQLYGGLSGKCKEDFGKYGNAKYVSYSGIFNNLAVNSDCIEPVTIGANEKQRRVIYGDVLFTGSSETPDEVAYSSVVDSNLGDDIYLNSFSVGYRFNNLNDIDPGFVKYVFRSRTLRRQLRKTAMGVTRFNVSKNRLKKVKICIPSLSEQHRIKNILDKFSAMTTSLTDGLPAEIALRQKQYEYYRDKLLTFKEKVQ